MKKLFERLFGKKYCCGFVLQLHNIHYDGKDNLIKID